MNARYEGGSWGDGYLSRLRAQTLGLRFTTVIFFLAGFYYMSRMHVGYGIRAGMMKVWISNRRSDGTISIAGVVAIRNQLFLLLSLIDISRGNQIEIHVLDYFFAVCPFRVLIYFMATLTREPSGSPPMLRQTPCSPSHKQMPAADLISSSTLSLAHSQKPAQQHYSNS